MTKSITMARPRTRLNGTRARIADKRFERPFHAEGEALLRPLDGMSALEIKSAGAHYTPPDLAAFLAALATDAVGRVEHLRVLDPACGDGGLLAAIAQEAPGHRIKGLELVGVDQSPNAVEAAKARLGGFSGVRSSLAIGDFLGETSSLGRRQVALFAPGGTDVVDLGREAFDLVIANPPYVRTQVMGAKAARRLAAENGLSGRVDLYHGFVNGMTACLRDGGILALLCSNRFLFTLAGQSVRRTLATGYELLRIIDLGDTKLFGAAVLPAIVIARKSKHPSSAACRMTRVYEVPDRQESDLSYTSIPAALQEDAEGIVQVGTSTYRVEHGSLGVSGVQTEPWFLSSAWSRTWLETVARRTAKTFDHVGRIRVGIKTTADAVFIGTDWASLPAAQRPETKLLRPLITHKVAERWRVGMTGAAPRVLYPYVPSSGKRRPIDLVAFPRAAAYLRNHRKRLESRTYLRESGRQWFEIWVPQNPGEWSLPKIVFPDISAEPKFFLDRTGAIVNGDCYWITCRPGEDADWLYLMLAVANSSFAVRFYDTVCGNRLYAGRRRFITQYVSRFPLPDLHASTSRNLVGLVGEIILRERPTSAWLADAEHEINRLVWQSFGLVEEAAG